MVVSSSSSKSPANYSPVGAGYSVPASTIQGGEGRGVSPSPSNRTWRNDASGSGGYAGPNDYSSTSGSVVSNGIEISPEEQAMIQKYSSNPNQAPTAQQLRDYSRAVRFEMGRQSSKPIQANESLFLNSNRANPFQVTSTYQKPLFQSAQQAAQQAAQQQTWMQRIKQLNKELTAKVSGGNEIPYGLDISKRNNIISKGYSKLEKVLPELKIKINTQPVYRKETAGGQAYSLLGKQTIIKSTKEPAPKFLQQAAVEAPLFALFSPLMSTGALAKKTKTVLQGLIPEETITRDTAEAAVREAYLQNEQGRIRDLLRKAYNSGDKDIIKKAEDIVKSSLGKAGSEIIKDMRAQEIVKPVSTNLFKIEQTPIAAPKLEKLPYLEQSAYTGSQYGIPTSQKEIIERPAIRTPTIFSTKDENRFFEPSASRFGQAGSSKLALFEGTVGGQGVKTRLIESAAQKANQSSSAAQILGLQTAQAQPQALRTLQKLRTAQAQKFRLFEQQNALQKSTSKIPSLISKIKSSPKIISLLNPNSKYNIFVKKAGKDISIGSATDKKEAAHKLLSTLKGSLRASGYVTQGSNKVSLAGLYGNEFRPAKRDLLRVVQKARFRLSSGGEKKEIQFSKRNIKPKFIGRLKI